jgi:hypothetical protein
MPPSGDDVLVWTGRRRRRPPDGSAERPVRDLALAAEGYSLHFEFVADVSRRR